MASTSPDPVPVSKEELKNLITSFGLTAFQTEVLQCVRNSIFAIAKHEELHRIDIGESRIGGAPDLPANVEWPKHDGKPLSFLAQIRLSDIAPHDLGLFLPHSGYLYFFYNVEQGDSVWGFDPKDFGHWNVIFVDSGATLTRVPIPAALQRWRWGRQCGAYASSRLKFFAQPSLPEKPPVALTTDQVDAYDELRGKLGNSTTHHQLLGFSGNIQGEMEIECQLVSHGIYCGNSHGYKSPKAAELKKGAKDWRLLFQIDSDDESKMTWGDLGRLYFWIKEDDLRNCNFDKVWMILQCY